MPGIETYERQVLTGRVQLPLLQRITSTIVRSLQGSMMTSDALGRAGTSHTGIAKGPLPPVQTFLRPPGELWPNAPASMATGIPRSGNYKAGVGQGRGQSQGL